MNNIIQTKSSVFNVNADTLVNTINCVGFMGKGIAYEFGLRYPEMLKIYQNKCQNKEIEVGNLFIYKENDITIINFPTKKDYKFPSRIDWIEAGLIKIAKEYKENGIKTIAMPPLGCGLGGLNINAVIPLIEKHLGNLPDLTVYICFDTNPAEGKEKEMIDMFNRISIMNLKEIIRLNKNQINNLENAQNHIKRFRDLQSLPSIGLNAYKDLFHYFYNYSNNNEQLSLFN